MTGGHDGHFEVMEYNRLLSVLDLTVRCCIAGAALDPQGVGAMVPPAGPNGASGPARIPLEAVIAAAIVLSCEPCLGTMLWRAGQRLCRHDLHHSFIAQRTLSITNMAMDCAAIRQPD